MSATLFWRRCTVAKSGTTVGALFTDLRDAVLSVAADADYEWEVASSNVASTPYYVVLKRKDASAGRVLIVCWTSAPAGNNAAILQQTPVSNAVHMAWFPSGNADTPSNLTASSGTILGDDSGCVKCCSLGPFSTNYASNFTLGVWHSAEAVLVSFQNPASATTMYLSGAGDIVVDAADDAYGAVFTSDAAQATGNAGNFSAATSFWMQWAASAPNAGAGGTGVRTNFGGTDRYYTRAYVPSGWANAGLSSVTSVMYDATLQKAWFEPFPLICSAGGVGVDLKLRQIAIGPPVTGAYGEFNTLSLTPAAINTNANTGEKSGSPWLTNFKI